MNGCHAVGAMRSDDGQIGHANFSYRPLLDEADVGETAFVTGEARTRMVKMPAIDLVDNFQMARQQEFKPLMRPFFQCFG